MTSFDDIGTMIDDIAEEIPEVFYNELNGGINLLPGMKLHPESNNSGYLFIMGEYHYDPRGLGRFINIYYGSFMRVYAFLPPEQQKEKLRQILLHEFTHHLESLGGLHTLAVKDAQALMRYKREHEKE
jgi:hypothetical protein